MQAAAVVVANDGDYDSPDRAGGAAVVVVVVVVENNKSLSGACLCGALMLPSVLLQAQLIFLCY